MDLFPRLQVLHNAAERELRAVALGRKNWTFAGSDEGGRRAAAIYTLIATAKLNGIDPQAWLADVLTRLPDHSAKRIHELLPWNWHRQTSPPTLLDDHRRPIQNRSALWPSPDAYRST